jgi:putative ABC transport system permease protein
MNTLSDLRMGFRLLSRRPAVTAGAVLSLALGIGANTAIFSVFHRVVLSPLPYRAPEELVVVWETSAENPERSVAPANFVDWRREATAFASLAAFDEFRPTMTRAAATSDASPEPEVIRAVSASGSFFTTLGISAAVGRTLLPDDDDAGATPVAVLGHGLWQRAFGGSAVIGHDVTLNGQSHTIVGVMPDTFESPLQTSAIDLWVNGDRGVPRTFPFGGDVTTVRDSHIISVLGRLKPGVAREAAQQEMTTLMQDLARRYPDTNAGLGVNVQSLHAQVVGNVSRLVTLLQLAVVMMLLIACANVAHLLLGQAVSRHSEMATRVALGAGRGRLLRQLLLETLTIAIPGGILGLLLATGGLQALVAAAPQGLPRLNEITIDSTVLAFTMMVTMATAGIFGLGPAWHLSRDATIAHAQSTTRVSGARSVRRWHHAIVVVELASAQVLLIGAGLLFSSLLAAGRVPLGFENEGRIAAELNLAADRYLTRVSGSNAINVTPKLQFVDRVLARTEQTPGVRAVAAAFTAPLTGAPNRGIAIEGRPVTNLALGDTADFQVITPDFFRAIGATLIRGRAFSANDTADSTPVVIVNQSFVNQYLAGQDPLGRRVRFGGSLEHEIVGVVGDMRYRTLEQPADATFYLPITQNAERWPFLSFVVWTDGASATALSALRAAIREADPNQPIMRLRTFDDILSTALAPRRFNTTLVMAFAGTALLLSAIGTYGVMAFAVSTRTRELGVRAALGATPRDLLRLVLRGGATLTAIALALGLAGGVAGSRLLDSMLYGVTPGDPVTYVGVAVTLTAVALFATWLPARSAIAKDPVRTLTHPLT